MIGEFNFQTLVSDLNPVARNGLELIRSLIFVVLVVAVGWSPALSAADEINVTARVDRNQMRPGDTFTYSISVSASGSVDLSEPKLPDLSSFEIINSWSGSESRASFTNGQIRTQRSVNYNYMMSAQKEGEFTIGAAEVRVGEQVLRSNSIKVEVSANAPDASGLAQQQNNQQGVSPNPLDQMEDDIFSRLLRRGGVPRGRVGGGQLSEVDLKDSFFIQVETDKKSVYQGEQIVATWYLVTRAQIADIDTLKYPSLSGFWKEDIEVATRLSFQPEVINGVPYQRAKLASYALFPIKSGKASIDPYEARCRVVGLNRMGFPSESFITKKSESIPIEVKQLPEKGQVSTFSGGVGDFVVVGTVDTNQLKANSPLTLKIRIEGRGNAKVVDMPKLNLPEFVQVYDTKTDMKYFPNGRSFKEFETLLLPREAGQFVIPAIEFTFFNPETAQYYSKNTTAMTIDVTPGEGGKIIPSQELITPNLVKSEKATTLPGVLLDQGVSTRITLASQIGIWGLVFVLTTLGLFGFGYRELGMRKKHEDLVIRVKKGMAKLRSLKEKGDWRRVGVEATNLVYIVLAEVAGLDGAAFEFDKILESAPPSFKRTVAPQLKAVMSKLEVLGFAPEKLAASLREPQELNKLLDETEKNLLASCKYDFKGSGMTEARSES